ncbi:MAG TPA: DNA primase [Anaeromyxobacteraceae bacterium]|nr:DNA primase [Anaeromyxobacteraceae bacterium]
MIPEPVIEEIKRRVDVVAVIGRHMELKKSGRTWKGCCIFHGERTASFHVYPEDKHFKCYGCGEYGDVFKFLQKVQGKEFPEVVRALAAEVGVEIPEATEDSVEARARRKERNEALAACEAAARYFAARLWSRYGGPGRDYLASRGVTEESARLFRLGLAAPGWNDLGGRLAEKGIGEGALERAGLLVRKEDRAWDRFRGRLMFPIAGLDGQPIGFGGRAMGEEKGAKYINSPETVLYKKSRVLYGVDLAREAIRKSRGAVLVEGYFDVIGLHQAGVKNAVAVCGTALTPEHLELLRRCDCREVTILFDGDPAGLAAPARAAEALLPSGISGKVAVLPGKTDPDEFARGKGSAAVEGLLSGAAPLTDFLIDRAVERSAGGRPADASVEQKLATVRELEPLVRLTPEGLARSVFEERIARRLELDVGALRAEIEREPRSPSGSRPHPSRHTGPPSALSQGERGQTSRSGPTSRVPVLLPGPAVDALGLLAAFPELAEAAADEDLSRLFPEGPIAELARALIREPLPLDGVLSRLAPAADRGAVERVRRLAGPGRPRAEDAEREFRRAAVEAKIEANRREQDRLLALVAKAGSPPPEDLTTEQLALQRRRADLEKRREKLRRT